MYIKGYRDQKYYGQIELATIGMGKKWTWVIVTY